jgi:hypothetical protein
MMLMKKAIRVPNDEPESWAPTMPKEDDTETPHTPPTTIVIRDTAPIEERGYAGDSHGARRSTVVGLRKVAPRTR